MMRDDAPGSRFAGWLQSSMLSRGLTQAQLARSVGVADTQISRWRRGQVVPTLQYLQRLADTFGVQRVTLDQIVGLPVAQALPGAGAAPIEPELEAELQAHQARLRQAMLERLPHSMWRAYTEACLALADGLDASARGVLSDTLNRAANASPQRGAVQHAPEPPPERPLGFRS